MTRGFKADCVEVMRRSSVLPKLWVWKVTCCCRSWSVRSSRNCVVCRSDCLLTWMLKSPVIMYSCGVVVVRDRNAEKSDRKDEKDDLCEEESGGR